MEEYTRHQTTNKCAQEKEIAYSNTTSHRFRYLYHVTLINVTYSSPTKMPTRNHRHIPAILPARKIHKRETRDMCIP